MKFLVTGASGFIGGAIARLLHDSGHQVRAFVRPSSSLAPLEGRNVERVEGNVRNKETLKRAATGCDGIFHAAALYSYWTPDPKEVYAVNVDGTENVAEAAISAGIPRIVFTSTVATFRWPGKHKLVTETSLAAPSELPSHYKKSKLMAEQVILSFKTSVDIVVTNPTAPFGPWDIRPTPTGRIVIHFLRNMFPGYVASGINVCSVSDVAKGHLAAFEKGKNGERYILGSENMSLKEIYRSLSESTGLTCYPVKIPFPLAFAAAFTDEKLRGHIMKREPALTLDALRVAKHPMYSDFSKAKRHLGYAPVPGHIALAQSAEWFSKKIKTTYKPKDPTLPTLVKKRGYARR